MKNKNLLKIIGIFAIGLTILTSCSNDDDENSISSDNSLLFDKWWYDSNNYTADVYFDSNGEYEQKIILLGTEKISEGNWTWEDENSSIMKIDNLGGDGQVVSSVWFRFSEIEEHTFTVQQSTNGTDYSSEVYYQDTEN